MLKIIVVCDNCKKENDRFLVRLSTDAGWRLDNAEPVHGIHVCSKECAIAIGQAAARSELHVRMEEYKNEDAEV